MLCLRGLVFSLFEAGASDADGDMARKRRYATSQYQQAITDALKQFQTVQRKANKQ